MGSLKVTGRAMAAAAAMAAGAMGYGDHNPYPYTVHPGFTVEEMAIPKHSNMGINWLSNGDMVLTTAATEGDYGGGGVPGPNAESGVLIVSGIAGGNPTVKRIASMFRQPTGSVVVNDVIYVADRDAFYKLNSLSPASPGSNRTKVIDFPKEKAPGFREDWNNGWWHQWVFCPVYYNGKFYAVYSGSIVGGGASETGPSTSYSGAYLSWAPDGAGGLQRHAGGFRSPNGAGLGANGMMLVADNQGSFEPSCPLSLIKPNKFYGHRQNKGHTANWAQAAYEAGTMEYEPPVAWMLDGDAPNGGGPGQATSQPLYLDRGPYAGDWIAGDNNSKGISRIALDPVDGGSGVTARYNGSVTFFTSGFGGPGAEAGVNRLALHPTLPILYVGTLGTLGNWPKSIAMPFYSVRFDDAKAAATFEIRAVRSRQNGIEIEFSHPINPATAKASSFILNHYQITRQDGYGAGNDAIVAPQIATVQASEDAKRVYLQTGNTAKIDRVLKITAAGIRSASGGTLFFNQAWFTHNYQSTAAFNPGTVSARAPVDRYLENHVDVRPAGGALSVSVRLEGEYTVSLRGPDGSLLETRSGRGPAELVFAPKRRGLAIVQVIRGAKAYAKPVFL